MYLFVLKIMQLCVKITVLGKVREEEGGGERGDGGGGEQDGEGRRRGLWGNLPSEDEHTI